jgi:hypothetical protein
LSIFNVNQKMSFFKDVWKLQPVKITRKVPLRTIFEYSMWCDESIKRALLFAAYKNDTKLFGWVCEDAQVTRLTMDNLKWAPLFMAARNNSLEVVLFVAHKFGEWDEWLRLKVMEEAISCGATQVVEEFANGKELVDVPHAVHTAVTFNHIPTLTLILTCRKGVSLESLYETGLIQHLVDKKMWGLLRLVVNEE